MISPLAGVLAWGIFLRLAPAAPPATYLGRYDAAAVRAAATAAVPPLRERGGSDRWEIAEWPAMPGNLVALSFRPAAPGQPASALDPLLVVLADGGDGLAARGWGSPSLDGANCENTSGGAAGDRPPELALDLAPYRIAPASVALGLRLSCENAFPAGEGNETRLWLFQLRRAVLTEVFGAPVAWANIDRAGGDDTEARGVIVVDRTKHGDQFDLLLKETVSTRPLGADDAPARTKTTTRRFVWTGARYAPAP